MSRGMWTKCWTLDGSQSFYYNAAKNQSVWQPPPDAIIHEAIHLKQYDNSTDSTPINDNVTYQAITTTSNYNNHNNIHIPTTATLTATSSSSKVQEDETMYVINISILANNLYQYILILLNI